MSKKGKKFDLSHFVNTGDLKDGQTLFFVSDPSKTCKIARHPSGEYKVTVTPGKFMTVHQFAAECLGGEPPVHATKWLKLEDGKILYDLWQDEAMKDAA